MSEQNQPNIDDQLNRKMPDLQELEHDVDALAGQQENADEERMGGLGQPGQ